MKTVMFLLVVMASSLNAQTFAEKILGNQAERRVDYKESNGVAIHGTVIKQNGKQYIEVVQVEPSSRTIYIAERENGKVLFYFPLFDNCNPGYRVVRYALQESVAGMKETKGHMSWHCAVKLKLLTKPVGTRTALGRSIQQRFDVLVAQYKLPGLSSGSQSAYKSVSEGKSKDGWQWTFTKADGVVLAIAVVVFFISKARGNSNVEDVLCAIGLGWGILFDLFLWINMHYGYYSNPFGGAGIMMQKHVSWHEDLVMFFYFIQDVIIGLIPIGALFLGKWVRNKNNNSSDTKRFHST